MKEYSKQHPETIQAMFGSIARQYDKANAILSFNLHKYWNKQLVNSVLPKNRPLQFADLCCGTGEITWAYLQKNKEPCTVYLIDFCPEMLFFAREKSKKLEISQHKLAYIESDVQKIPLDSQTIDCATMAYGIRNVQNPKSCLQEVYRVLKEGGTFGILELTQPDNKFLQMGHKFYLQTCLPMLGKLVTSNKDAYEYLCNSIHNFVKPSEVKTMMMECGFSNVEIKPLNGGIATLITAQK